MRLFTLPIMTVCLLLGADEPPDAAKKELANFQGTWVLVSATRAGKKVPQEGVIKLQITGNKYRLTQESSAVIGHQGTQTLDPAKKPKETDVTVTEGPDKGKTFLGVYTLEGDDFKVCFAPPGKARPQMLTAPAGSDNLLQVWKREKK